MKHVSVQQLFASFERKDAEPHWYKVPEVSFFRLSTFHCGKWGAIRWESMAGKRADGGTFGVALYIPRATAHDVALNAPTLATLATVSG